MPAEGGYAGVLYGRVVDMFYFPMINGHFPDWFPIWGGEEFQFFRPIFNFADASISVGVAIIILFHKRFSQKPESENIETEVLKHGGTTNTGENTEPAPNANA
mgnify:FL=1